MNLKPEVYTAVDGEWNYRIGHIKSDAWSVVRWPVDKAYIPPRSEILTVDGWTSLLKNEAVPRYFNTSEVDMIGTGALLLPS